MKLIKYSILWGVLYEGGRKMAGEEVVKTCVKHSTMREKEKGYSDPRWIVVLGEYRINSSCTVPISKEKRY